MKTATPICMELLMSAFFFGHTGKTLLEQADTCGVAMNMKDFIINQAPFAIQAPAMNYESLFKYVHFI